MGEIKALEVIREWSKWLDCTYATDDGESYNVYSYKPYENMKSCGEHIREQCGAIQAEVDERFMELPMDADGVPIRVGDKVQFRNDAPVTVDSIGTGKVYANDSGFFGSNGGFYGQGTLKNVHHVKPRTLESVLQEYGSEIADSASKPWSEIVDKYAAEIRELMGVER